MIVLSGTLETTIRRMLPVTLQGLEHSDYQGATKFIETSDASKMGLGGEDKVSK